MEMSHIKNPDYTDIEHSVNSICRCERDFGRAESPVFTYFRFVWFTEQYSLFSPTDDIQLGVLAIIYIIKI